MTETLVVNYEPSTSRFAIYYGWVNVVIAAIAMVATLPGRTMGLGLITEPLLRDLKIDATGFAMFNLYATLIGSTFCMICGPLIDRVGSRLVLTATFAMLGASVLWMARSTTHIELLITLIFTRGFGQSMLSVVSLTLVGKWFSRRLPVAMGIYSVLMGTGFMIAFPGIGAALGKHGWREVWGWMGWVMLVGLALLAFLITRSTPESLGLKIDGQADSSDEASLFPLEQKDESGLTLFEALGSMAFWSYALSASLYGLVATGLMLFNERVLKSHGFDESTVKMVLYISIFGGLIANFGAGYLARTVAIGKLLAVAMFVLAFALFCLPLATTKPLVFLYAITIGLSGGIITVGFFVCWGKIFGRRHLGAIQGAAQALTVLASAAGPVMLAECMRIKNSATPLLFGLAPAVVVLGLFCLFSPLPSGYCQTQN
jgi:cyanate permease